MVEDYQENYITGWIKLYRSFIKWEWFEVPNMVTVFIYCLLKANHKDKTWRGIEIKRGTFITSLETMKNETKISTQSIRTCLKRLEKSGEINKQSNKANTLITICNYDSYQDYNDMTNTQSNKQLTNDQQTANKQLTTTNNDNNIKNDKNNIKDRKNKFFLSFTELVNNDFKEVPQDVIKDFFEYWTEHGEKDKKMRFEKEKSFNKKLRFSRWLKNKEKWNKQSTEKKVISLAEKMRKDYGIQ